MYVGQTTHNKCVETNVWTRWNRMFKNAVRIRALWLIEWDWTKFHYTKKCIDDNGLTFLLNQLICECFVSITFSLLIQNNRIQSAIKHCTFHWFVCEMKYVLWWCGINSQFEAQFFLWLCEVHSCLCYLWR